MRPTEDWDPNRNRGARASPTSRAASRNPLWASPSHCDLRPNYTPDRLSLSYPLPIRSLSRDSFVPMLPLSPSHPPPLALSQNLAQRVRQALSEWYSDAPDPGPLADLAVVQQTQASGGWTARRAANNVLAAALDRLASDAPQEAKLLRRRFVDEAAVYVVAREFDLAESTFYKRQRQAIAALAGVLAGMETAARDQRSATAATRLPWIDHGRLFGVEPLLGRLDGLLTAAQPPAAIVLLTGLGGVGKTTVARSALDQIVQSSPEAWQVGWVSAQQQSFHPSGVIRPLDAPALTADDLLLALASQLLPAAARVAPFTSQRALDALQTHLRQTPHVVVIDNLETLADVEALLPTLRRLAGPSRFLLTSRKVLPGERDIYHLPVPELSEADALALVRFEAATRNLQAVSEAGDADLRPIYETVGGVPLALKLVVGQLYLLPLPQVVDNLRQARGQKIADLYRYVYWQAWNQLDADAQDVLLGMPVFAQGGADLAGIERISEVQGGRLVQALERLAHLSLVNVAGDLWTRRYSIHRLTETFMIREVIRWQGSAAEWDDDLPDEATR